MMYARLNNIKKYKFGATRYNKSLEKTYIYLLI